MGGAGEFGEWVWEGGGRALSGIRGGGGGSEVGDEEVFGWLCGMGL